MALFGRRLDVRLARHDILDGLRDASPVLKLRKGNALAHAVRDEVVPLLRKQQIRLLGRAQVRHAVAGVEHGRPHARGQLRVRLERQALVVPVPRVVVVHNVPAVDLVERCVPRLDLDVVGDDLDLLVVRPNEVLQQRLDDGHHAARDDDDGDVLLQRPLEEGLEAGVELDVLDERRDTLIVRCRDAVHHLLEGVTEVNAAFECGFVACHALLLAEAEVVCLGGRSGSLMRAWGKAVVGYHEIIAWTRLLAQLSRTARQQKTHVLSLRVIVPSKSVKKMALGLDRIAGTRL
ncbi:hypothetical protein FH972_022395 [Carpinus fangiana]|uniref:Uncharacterized protein n=1 Tax=Carpinus fangiana TaxID=176857 RepID=A0A5N6KS57_9ROSI|nr:hypothetical protein FH972_022395 [Carpinus fangiana]